MDTDMVDTPEYNYWVQQLKQQREEHLQKCKDDMQNQRNADRAECKELLEKLEDENIELQAKNKELKSMSDLKYKNKVADMKQKHKASLENQRNRQLYEYKRGIQNQINTDRAECENVVQNVRAEYEDALNNANAIIKAKNTRVGNKKTPKTVAYMNHGADITEMITDNLIMDYSVEDLREMFTYFGVSDIKGLVYRIISMYMDSSKTAEMNDPQDEFKESIENGDIENVRKLLQNPNVDPGANYNWAIKYAAEYGWDEVVEVLLQDKRVDPNGAIELAIEYGWPEAVEVLLTDDRVEIDGWAVYDAIEGSGSTNEVVKLLLADPRVDPSYAENAAIQSAARWGHFEIVELLLEDPRVDPSDDDNDAIRMAADAGHLEIVKLLLENPKVRDLVLKNKTPEIAYKMLMDYDSGFKEIFSKTAFSHLPPDVLPRYVAPKLGLDKYKGMYPTVQSAEMAGANAAQQNYFYTRIHAGSTYGVERLLDDSRVNPRYDDNLAIAIAARQGHIEIVQLLLTDPRVDPSDANNRAIREAADAGHLEIVKLLLENPKVRDLVEENKTPEIAYRMLMGKYDSGFKEVFCSKNAGARIRLPPHVLTRHVAPKLGIDKYENML